jgi:hypothetical protein
VAKAAEAPKGDFRVWCEHCSIRVAPNELQTVVAGKTYHLQCYPKAMAKTKARRRTK